MTKRNWLKSINLNIQKSGVSASLILLALTQIPIAIKNAAEVACIGEVSNQIWRENKSHRKVNSIAVQRCNGGNNF